MDYTSLMSCRIRRILLICNNYDSFSLEEDGRIESLIESEYNELNLSNPPSIVRVESTLDALELLNKGERFDLVLTMYNVGELSVFDFAHKAKELCPNMPLVLLSGFAKEIFRQMDERDCSDIDHIFCWNNSTDLIIAIIKLIEDSQNAEKDILHYGVQAILLVEDSVRYYSTYLPALYNIVLHQNSSSVRDALNEQQMMARKRARPKILMAKDMDSAVELFEKYRENLLGVITDVGFVLHKGDRRKDEKIDAGVELCHLIKSQAPKMPILMQSSQESMRKTAEQLKVGFLLKSSKTLTYELADYIGREFGFGDFVLCEPKTGQEIARASDLKEFEQVISSIPAKFFRYFSDSNYLSKWLFARGLFSIGKVVRSFQLEDFPDIEENRRRVVNLVHDFRVNQALGVVAKFDPLSYNDAICFSSVGKGSMGGKARGLAFLNHILKKYDLYDQWDGVRVMLPKTLVVNSEYFERFIIENGLKYVINSELSDEEILSEFVASTLPEELLKALKVFIHNSGKPLAIRSSSRLEDSYYQPFAGVYSTYMIPHTENEDQQLRLLSKAIKSVYASVFFSSSRRYITSAANVISEEKMSVVIQEICGSVQGNCYLPTISGVARSSNYYPVGREKAEDGIIKIAYGLGKAVVDGEQVLRVCPRLPKCAIQTSTPEHTMSDTQQVIYALDLQAEGFKTSIDDSVNLRKLSVRDCESFSSLAKVASTWDRENQRIVDSVWCKGPRFITFAPVLKYNTFPLTDICRRLMDISKQEMKCDVEIEFAVDMDVEEGSSAIFNVLQIRPISVDSRNSDINWSELEPREESLLLKSSCALGTGHIEGIRNVIYLKQDSFDILHTREMADALSRLNAQMQSRREGYLLIGFGRWGSSIDSLGVPVKWSDITEAKAIVECSLPKFRVDPSQGTHFFQNMTSFNVGYINVDPYGTGDDMLDFGKLDALPAVWEDKYLRQVCLDKDLEIIVDGKNSRALIQLAQD
ncbi:MAG: PEP/pyruvate-binding domain-containing protein [Candidatus Cryptobacteroides sp.]